MSDQYGYTNGTTAWPEIGDVAEYCRNLAKVFRESCPPLLAENYALYVHDKHNFVSRRVTLDDLLDWKEGRLPSFLDDFDGWWLATLLRHGGIKEVWRLNLDAIMPKWPPIQFTRCCS